MQTALTQLAEDFLSTFAFLIAYFVTSELFLAVGVAGAIGSQISMWRLISA